MKQQYQPPTPAALYARVSSDRQDVDLSVAAQLRALRDYAKNNGYSIAREYVDEAESGKRKVESQQNRHGRPIRGPAHPKQDSDPQHQGNHKAEESDTHLIGREADDCGEDQPGCHPHV